VPFDDAWDTMATIEDESGQPVGLGGMSVELSPHRRVPLRRLSPCVRVSRRALLRSPIASVCMAEPETPAPDDQQARKVRPLLLGKGVVSAHRIERPFAARLDDDQQSDAGARRHRDERLQ
jgi:hypothetical protein